MTSVIVQLDQETQGYRISALQEARLAAMLGRALLNGIVTRTKGAVADPIIDLDAHEVRWPNAAEDDALIRLLGDCLPADLADPNLHRLSVEKLALHFLDLAFPKPKPIFTGPWVGPG